MISEQDITSLERHYQRITAELEVTRRSLNRKRMKLRAQKRYHTDVLLAQELIQLAAQITQRDLQFHISDLVTSALYSVFPKPYKFIVSFVKRRGVTECDMLFEKNGTRKDPEFASGGGPLDVASFASRISQLTLEGVRLLVILDEPFKNLSKSLINNACEMLKSLSKELGIQFIIVTHVPELIKAGDKVFEVESGEIKEWQTSQIS